jgi:hypothetical protein
MTTLISIFTVLMRGKSEGYIKEYAENMRKYGWEQDSILFIQAASDVDKQQAANSDLTDIYDESTRTCAVWEVDKINEVPAHYITLPADIHHTTRLQ